MADRHDSTLASEKLGLYGIVIGLIGIATAYLAFGLAQLKIFEVYLPYIFISVGVVYIVLSVVLINSIRKSGQIQSGYRGGTAPSSGTKKFASGIGTFFAAIGNQIKSLMHLLYKHKLPLFVGLAFVAGIGVTYVIISGPNFNFTLPSFQFPSPANQSTTSSAVTKLEVPNVPTTITDFSVSRSGENYTLSFSLVDKDSTKLNASGSTKLKIVDQSSKVLYEESFDVSDSDFTSAGYTKTIEVSKVNKTVASSGTALISFVPDEGTEITGNSSVDVPIYTLSELEAMNENDYIKSATAVGKTVSKYAFDVTLVRIGFYTKVEGSDEKIYYRADISVKNKFAVETEFKASTGKLTVGGNSYTPDVQSTLKTANVKGGSAATGYLLFKDVPSSISGSIKIRAGTATANEEVEYIFDV